MPDLTNKHLRLSQLRPLAPAAARSLAAAWDVRMVYESNSIEGNSLTLRETEIVLSKGVTVSGKPLKGLRVGVYQHSTVARDMLVVLLEAAGAIVTALGRSGQFIPVDTEAVSAETQGLIRGWCAGGKFDAIVSADGDGDRPLVADEKGQVLRGDLVGLITARFLGAQVVVTPITSNSGLDAHLPKGTRRSRVGSPYVIAEMMKAKKARACGLFSARRISAKG